MGKHIEPADANAELTTVLADLRSAVQQTQEGSVEDQFLDALSAAAHWLQYSLLSRDPEYHQDLAKQYLNSAKAIQGRAQDMYVYNADLNLLERFLENFS